MVSNVLEEQKLSLESASRFYRMRWENEGFFRTYKRALNKVKLSSRSVKLIHREVECLASLGVALVYAGHTVAGLAAFDRSVRMSHGVLTGHVLHRRALAQGEGADVVSGSVETEQQAGVALLGSTRAAGCQELEQAWAEVPAGAMRAPMTEVGCAGNRPLVVGRAGWRGRPSGSCHEMTSVGLSSARTAGTARMTATIAVPTRNA